MHDYAIVIALCIRVMCDILLIQGGTDCSLGQPHVCWEFWNRDFCTHPPVGVWCGGGLLIRRMSHSCISFPL
jgi:hypothetical protein